MTAITTKASRREHDFYPTPGGATQILIQQCPEIRQVIFECCSGADDIARGLDEIKRSVVYTNDIDCSRFSDFHEDVSTAEGWHQLVSQTRMGRPDWIVTNPPFNVAPAIVPLAYDHAYRGIAMLLRLSFLEPCLNRIEFLSKHPPTKLIVIPRISFTGDGKTDSVCTAWMVWDKRRGSVQDGDTPIVIVGR